MFDPHARRRAAFRALHLEGCFVLPNPWDVGSAKRLEGFGFRALASTSAGMAWALGKSDGEVTRDEAIAHLKMLCAATDLPVNADFEDGFGETPTDVAESVALAIDAGVAGLSIEDWSGDALYELPVALDRLRAARSAIDASGRDVILVARTEGYLRGRRELGPTLERLKAYADAGADCLYAPAISDPIEIKTVVQAMAPKPVNILLWGDNMSVDSLAALGVRRVSTGGALAAAAWAGFETAAKPLAEAARRVSGE
jgi:2-methylisocitrate lyase-like PEP mutase family enzyme